MEPSVYFVGNKNDSLSKQSYFPEKSYRGEELADFVIVDVYLVCGHRHTSFTRD